MKANLNQRCPLRKITGYENIPVLGGYLQYEILECGHKQSVKTDIYGETNANRRRCRKCCPARPVLNKSKHH